MWKSESRLKTLRCPLFPSEGHQCGIGEIHGPVGVLVHQLGGPFERGTGQVGELQAFRVYQTPQRPLADDASGLANQVHRLGVLRAELDQVRHDYNDVRLHAVIGYVTPNDEHEGRGPAIRQARKGGMARARHDRIAYHQQQRISDYPPDGPHVD